MLQRPYPSLSLGRRAIIGAVAAAGGLALAGQAFPALSSPPRRQQIIFDVRRDGANIGRHEVSFRHRGDRLEVDVAIEIEVRLAFIPLFSYSHRNHEVWQEGRLVALDSETNDDGQRFAVTARSLAGGLRVVGSVGDFLAPRSILPASYWDPRTVEQSLLLDSQRGRLLEVRPVLVGNEWLDSGVPARRYSLSGDLNLDLWYSDEGEWMKIAFEARGADVSYARRLAGTDDGASG